MNENEDLRLVHGRKCGGCTVCCKDLRIKDPELRKHAGVLCQHCTHGGGCSIYDTRPNACKAWYCGWRMFESLNDDWRPDRCGILLDFCYDDIPPEFLQPGMKFTVTSNQPLHWDPMLQYVGALVEKRIAVFLSVGAPVGYVPRKILLNYELARAAQDHDRQGLIGGLLWAYDLAERTPKEMATFD